MPELLPKRKLRLEQRQSSIWRGLRMTTTNRRWPLWQALRLGKRTEAGPEPIHECQSLLRTLSTAMARTSDQVLKHQISLRLGSIAQELRALNQGTLTFHSTETWRTVYEEVLEQCTAKRYLSVALISHDAYWRDEPGQSSIQFNYKLIEHGFFIHRMFIIDDFLWPPAAQCPSRDVFEWITDQFRHGILVSLTRLSALREEPDLVRDFGIYGDRAVGYQRTDDEARTTLFELRFDKSSVDFAEQRWAQLQLFAVPIENLLDLAG